ncbi:MAG TPA: hypothetical protein VD963_11300 [Phycisphaerales bacterium]|nr:hypothetical protein [Phycisphaerales bacterium]
MPKRSSKRPDPNQIAARIVARATGAGKGTQPPEPDAKKNPAAVELGRLGGQKGGPARAKKLSKARRSEIARRAAKARWEDHPSG